MNKYSSIDRFIGRSQVMILLLILSFVSCSKEVHVDGAQGSRFLRIYGTEKAEDANFVRQTADGGFFVGGNNLSDSSLTVNRFDKLGHELNYSSFNSSKPVLAMGTALSSGGFMMNSMTSSQVARFDESGNMLSSKLFYPTASPSYLFSRPYQAKNGLIYIAYCNGFGTGSASINTISELDIDGNEIRSFTMLDAQIGGKVLELQVLKKEDDILFLSGNFFPTPYTWSDRIKHFVVKYDIQTNTVSGVLKFDLQDEKEDDFVNTILAYSNGQMALATSSMHLRFMPIPNNLEFEIFKFNSDLSLLWRNRCSVDGAIRTAAVDLCETSDGGMLVTGYCGAAESFTEINSFFLKLDQQGNVTAQKIFRLSGGLKLNSGIELADGSFVFVGTSLSFGLNKEQSTPVIMATDAQGNYE